jgi:hypothetical protein
MKNRWFYYSAHDDKRQVCHWHVLLAFAQLFTGSLLFNDVIIVSIEWSSHAKARAESEKVAVPLYFRILHLHSSKETEENQNALSQYCKRLQIFYVTADVIWTEASRLGGVVVSVLSTGRKGHGFKPGRGDGFLRTKKFRSTHSFGWEVKPEAPCRKILRHVKDPLTYQRYWISKILIPSSIPPTRCRCLCW